MKKDRKLLRHKRREKRLFVKKYRKFFGGIYPPNVLINRRMELVELILKYNVPPKIEVYIPFDNIWNSCHSIDK